MRYLRKRRELELRDLGGLVFDMYRFGSKRQDLVRDKLQAMFAADRELREFEQLLGRRPRRLDVREAGIGGSCPRCQQLYSTEARFCSRCGETLTDGTQPDTVIEAPRVAAPAAYSPAPVQEPRTQAWEDSDAQNGGSEAQDGRGRRFGRRLRKAPEPRPARPWQDAEPQTQARQDPEPQTQAREDPEPQTQAWQDKEPQTQAREDPDPQTQAWPDAEPQTQTTQGIDARTPAPRAQTPAWQAPAAQPQTARPEGEATGRGFKRRLRKSASKDARAAEEARRQREDWEAQYQASVEAQRQAWQDEEARPAQTEREDQTRAWQAQPETSHAEPESPDGQDARRDPAAPTEGGVTGLEAGDPLASRSGDPRR